MELAFFFCLQKLTFINKMQSNLTYMFVLFGNWPRHNGYRKKNRILNFWNHNVKNFTENYSCWCAHFQQFIPEAVNNTVVLELFNSCTILLWCYSATVFLAGSNIPFCFGSWTGVHDCHTVNGFLTVSILAFTLLLLKIVWKYFLVKINPQNISLV